MADPLAGDSSDSARLTARTVGMTVVVAPDSFKGSASAHDIAAAIARGWRSVRPEDDVIECPQADGGEGTMDAVRAAAPAARLRSAGPVTGPDGRQVEGTWLELSDGTAVIEIAQMSGLPLMSKLDPLHATSRGLGQVMAAAIDAGHSRLVVGLGGSASTDAGLPALESLGDRRPPRGGVLVLTDVTNPLLGPRGAAAVFGPQKGASLHDIAVLEKRLEQAALDLQGDPDAPGAGAAGGVGFGLAAWGATITPGSAYISRLTGLDELLQRADIVVTGEGRFDRQSADGKAAGRTVEAAHRAGATVGIIAGAFEPGLPISVATWVASLTDLAGSASRAIEDPLPYAFEAAQQIAHQRSLA